MSAHKWVVGAAFLGLILASEASAQDKTFGVAVRGGVMDAITYLNDAKTADFQKKGYSAGAGIHFDLGKYIAVRGDVSLTRNELSINDVGTGRDLSRWFYDASLQFQYPIGDFKPYIFLGAGAVRLHQVGTDTEDKTKFAGVGGYGVNYTIPGTKLAIGVEGKSWAYQLNGLEGQMSSYDKLQYDVTYSGTVSYSIPLGGGVKTASR